jgi:hypothetical protein
MKTRSLIFVILSSSLCSGILGAVLGCELFRHSVVDIMRVHQIQIEDSQGRIKAKLHVEKDGGAYLRFLTPDMQDAVVLGESGNDSMSAPRTAPAPVLQFNAQSGRGALRISTDSSDNGIVAFSDFKRENTLLLGYYPLPEQPAAASGTKYAWGLHVRREHGETGVGIIDTPGLPVDYISPVSQKLSSSKLHPEAK